MTFGQKLREARINKKYTQKDLAKMIGAKHNSISNWEHDQNKPDPDTIELLCGALDISANYLLGTDKLNDISPEAIEVAKAYDNADLKTKNIIRITLDLTIKKESKITQLPKKEEIPNHLILNAARPLKGATGEYLQHDEDIMDDPDF